jgi:hypothetical protein
VFFQRGAITLGYDQYAPGCDLEVRRLDANAVQYVKPGRYPVRSVQDTLEQVVIAQPLRLAMAGPLLALGDDDGGQPDIYRGYHLWLSGADANLMRLSCRGPFSEPSRAFPPSLEEMRAALGPFATIELP